MLANIIKNNIIRILLRVGIHSDKERSTLSSMLVTKAWRLGFINSENKGINTHNEADHITRMLMNTYK